MLESVSAVPELKCVIQFLLATAPLEMAEEVFFTYIVTSSRFGFLDAYICPRLSRDDIPLSELFLDDQLVGSPQVPLLKSPSPHRWHFSYTLLE